MKQIYENGLLHEIELAILQADYYLGLILERVMLNIPFLSRIPYGTKPNAHLNKYAIVSNNLAIKYNKESPPSDVALDRLKKAVNKAGSVMASTVWQLDKIVLFRLAEPPVTANIFDKHFGLGRDPNLANLPSGANAKGRRSYLWDVQNVMRSVSFHLNTGVYLLDIDAAHRKVIGDQSLARAPALWRDQNDESRMNPNIRGYVTNRRDDTDDGAMHISFAGAEQLNVKQIAAVIIHEATHAYKKTADVAYSQQDIYDVQSPTLLKNNADSFAMAAISLHAGAVVNSILDIVDDD